MGRKVLTDIELRAHYADMPEHVLKVTPDTFVTPAAKDFLKEKGITLEVTAEGSAVSAPLPESASRFPAAVLNTYSQMTVSPIASKGTPGRYVNYQTGRPLNEKPEDMTHLRGNQLVSKNHPRIAFRGKIDTLMAIILKAQVTAEKENRGPVCSALEELLDFVRQILACEVKDEPMKPMCLFGMNSEELREASHHVRESCGIDHPIPDHTMGALAMELNYLRTQVRETELAAMRAFTDMSGNCLRPDIIEALNRLSSGVYIVFLRTLSGYYGEGR